MQNDEVSANEYREQLAHADILIERLRAENDRLIRANSVSHRAVTRVLNGHHPFHPALGNPAAKANAPRRGL